MLANVWRTAGRTITLASTPWPTRATWAPCHVRPQVDFECGRIDEEHLCRIFFADGRPVDRQGLVDMLVRLRARSPWLPQRCCCHFWRCALAIGVPGCCLGAAQRSKYRYLEGVEQLLARLSRAGFEMHTLSNYPTWYRIIEEQLALSRYVQWSYVSCHGPMQVRPLVVPSCRARLPSTTRAQHHGVHSHQGGR